MLGALFSALSPEAQHGLLRAASEPYFLDGGGGVDAASFTPVGERGFLPTLRQHGLPPDCPSVMALVRAFIAVQIELSRGREAELAAIVEETEAVHRESLHTVLQHTVCAEPGYAALLQRTEALSHRLEVRSGGSPPQQAVTELGQLIHNNLAMAVRLDNFATVFANKTGCKLFRLAPQKSPLRVVEKVALAPAARGNTGGDHQPAAMVVPGRATELRGPELAGVNVGGIGGSGSGADEALPRTPLALDAVAAGPPDYSSSCDIGRHGLSYGSTGQMDTAVQHLQALDEFEAEHTAIDRAVFCPRVFGADAEQFRIVLLQTKHQIGAPYSSVHPDHPDLPDLTINFMFADDPTKTVFEFQLLHVDLSNVRDAGSHRFNKARSARELLEALGEEARIPKLARAPFPQPPSVLTEAAAEVGGGAAAAAAVVQKLQDELEAVKATVAEQADNLAACGFQLKAVHAIVAEQAAAIMLAVAELKAVHTTVAEQSVQAATAAERTAAQGVRISTLEAACMYYHHVMATSNTKPAEGGVMDAASTQGPEPHE